MNYSQFIVYIVSPLVANDLESANLEITPSPNVQAGSSALTIRCSAASGTTKLYNIKVKRSEYFDTGISYHEMGDIDVGLSATLGSDFTQPKYTATGSLTSVFQVSGYLKIVIKDPECIDQAEYTCITLASNKQGDPCPQHSGSRNVTVQSNPTNLYMSTSPEKSAYKEYEIVKFTCNGDTGRPRKIWSWQTQRFPDSTRWEKYPNNNDIKDGDIIPPSGNKCSYSQETILTYVIKAADNGLKIRCILDNMEEYSVVRTIYTSCSDQMVGSIMLICLTIFVIFGKNQ